MATHKGLTMGVCLQNYSYLSCYLSQTSKLSTNLKLRHMPIIPLYICKLSNLNIHIIYENIKDVIHDWGKTYKINTISAAFRHRILKFV